MDAVSLSICPVVGGQIGALLLLLELEPVCLELWVCIYNTFFPHPSEEEEGNGASIGENLCPQSWDLIHSSW